MPAVLFGGMPCQSPSDRFGPGFDGSSSSDYGSDFTPDEAELLYELLSKIGADEHTTTEVAAQPVPAVTDIEDHEGIWGVRVPKVRGREQWSPLSQRMVQIQSSGATGQTERIVRAEIGDNPFHFLFSFYF
jgi:exonuclease V